MKVAIQGIAGSFHEAALYKLYPEKAIELVPCDSFADVFKSVIDGKVRYGLCATENSLYGSINEVYRLFERYPVWITREVRLLIEQCLIASTDVTLEMLQQGGTSARVLSQAPALAQVEAWLNMHLPEATREETHDTAASVRYIMECGDKFTVAIAGKHAADIYGAHVVANNINDVKGNYTRFVLFSRNKESNNDATACSLRLHTSHSAGALYRALGVFAALKINLTKLDSHPIPGDQQHYSFYIDTDAPLHSAEMKQAIKELEAQGCAIRVLGSYQRTY